MSARRRTTVLAVFLLAHVLVDVLFTVAVVSSRSLDYPHFAWDPIAYSWFGVLFSQVSLLAFWNAFGSWPLVVRTAVSVIAGTVLFWLSGFINYPHRMQAVYGTAMLAQWILIQLPLWVARMRFGWCLKLRDHPSDRTIKRDVQFGIKHLIGWTTLVASLLGLGKFISLQSTTGQKEVIGFSLLLIFNSLFAWPTLLAGFATQRQIWGNVAALLFAIAITAAELYTFLKVMGPGVEIDLFPWFNGSQFIWIAGSAMVLRRIGFQLVRVRTD